MGLSGGRRRIFCIPGNGAADVRHLDTDLMVAPGVQNDLGQGQGIPGSENMIMKPRGFGARRIGGTDAGGVGPPVFYQIVFQVRFRLLRNST